MSFWAKENQTSNIFCFNQFHCLLLKKIDQNFESVACQLHFPGLAWLMRTIKDKLFNFCFRFIFSINIFLVSLTDILFREGEKEEEKITITLMFVDLSTSLESIDDSILSDHLKKLQEPFSDCSILVNLATIRRTRIIWLGISWSPARLYWPPVLFNSYTTCWAAL